MLLIVLKITFVFFFFVFFIKKFHQSFNEIWCCNFIFLVNYYVIKYKKI